ncbi:MAG TPA: hypothetical protein VHV08_03625, partial [Pirellulales bacterium]|nr:hypothetical protein [Pirellulales bacterium]
MTNPASPVTSTNRPASRREFLWHFGGGLGGIALAHIVAGDTSTAQAGAAPRKAGLACVAHHPPKAKRVVQFFMSG